MDLENTCTYKCARFDTVATYAMYRRVLIIVLLAGGTIGCLSDNDSARSYQRTDTPTEETEAPTSTGSETNNSHPALESQLYQLATADDPETYADEHRIELENGRVKVMIRLSNADSDVPPRADIDDRYGNRVDAWVHTDELIVVADDDAVEFVQLARTAQQQ
jgi:rRNA maturation protein Nop10